MKVVIVEDEQPAVTLLASLIHAVDPDAEIVQVLDSVRESVDWFKTHPQPDLVFMDIRLSDGLSFEIFREVDLICPIVFTTAYDEYIMRAFTVNSLDYLLKPIDREQVSRATDKFRKLRAAAPAIDQRADFQALASLIARREPIYKRRFLIPVGERYVSIPAQDVLYFVSAHKQTSMVTKENKRFLLDDPLESIGEQIDPHQFFRANRQYIVSFAAIAAIHTFFNGKLKVTLRGTEDEVMVSKEKAGEFKKWLDH